MIERIALFAGSFDPFTIGHKNIVERGLPLFDKIIIGIGINPGKKPWMPTEDRVRAVREAFKGEAKVEVASFEGLTIDFARRVGARFLLKGIRNAEDFAYEKRMADANRMLTLPDAIETVMIPALPEYEVVSSSLAREVAHFGGDVSTLLPY